MQTKAEFIEKIKQDSQSNIWMNELHLMRLTDELGLLRKDLAALDLELENKKKPAANEEKKRKFVLEQNIKHQEQEIAKVEATKKYNEYILNDLLPRYEAANKAE